MKMTSEQIAKRTATRIKNEAEERAKLIVEMENLEKLSERYFKAVGANPNDPLDGPYTGNPASEEEIDKITEELFAITFEACGIPRRV